MSYTLQIEDGKRIWSYNDKIVHTKEVKDKNFDIVDCQLSWLYLTERLSGENTMIRDIPLVERGNRQGCRDIWEKKRKIVLEFTDIPKEIVENILKTRLPPYFYLSKHRYDGDWESTRVAYTYKDIYKFLDYGDYKIKLKSTDDIIWGFYKPFSIVDGLPVYTKKEKLFSSDIEFNLGLHFGEYDKIFFPFYKGNRESVKALNLGIGRI